MGTKEVFCARSLVLFFFCLVLSSRSTQFAQANCEHEKISENQAYSHCKTTFSHSTISFSRKVMQAEECEKFCKAFTSQNKDEFDPGLVQLTQLANGLVKVASNPVHEQNLISEMKVSNQRFAEGSMEHPNQDQLARNELATQQNPGAVVLSCSDSRTAPEILFDKGLGDVFAVRTAGHTADTSAIASIEYAVGVLQVPTVIVMGHESCGAVKAALGPSAGLRVLDLMIDQIRPHVFRFAGNNDSANLDKAVKSHIHQTVVQLIAKSHLIRERVIEGKLSIVPAFYSLLSGVVTFEAFNIPNLIDTHHF